MRKYGWSDFKWKNDHLLLGNESMAYLVPHGEIPDHYFIKFLWRDEPTPEFFNKTNAKENARSATLHRFNTNPASVEATDAFK